MKLAAVFVAALLLGGCAQPSKVSTALSFGAAAPGLTTVVLKIKNQEERATTPLLVDVSLQAKDAGSWGPPKSVLHPSAFVLNRHEEQILRATAKLPGEAIRATVTVKELESGRTLTTQQTER